MPFALIILRTDRIANPPQLAAARSAIVEQFGFAPEIAAQEFVPAGSPDGAAPADVYWLSTQFTAEALAVAQQLAASPAFTGSQVIVYDPATAPNTPHESLTALNRQPLATPSPA